MQQEHEEAGGSDSEWESASDDEEEAAASATVDGSAGAEDAAAGAEMCLDGEDEELPDASTWEEWDPRRSLFDNHMCGTIGTLKQRESNL